MQSTLPPVINIIHMLFVAPLFFYIGYQQTNNPLWIYSLLGFLGLVVILYHAYRYYSTGKLINLIHILIGICLLLTYYWGATLPSTIYPVFMIASVIVFLVHSYLFYQKQ
jgi:uncharacterized membrane protein HdeD (DUF308 family)